MMMNMKRRLLTFIVAVLSCLQLSAQVDTLTSQMSMMPQRWNLPYYYGLHQGLNVSLSASVIAGFGKHAPKGAGFAQSLQTTYLTPLTPKLTLMAGGFVNNLNWGGINARNAGIYGELSYQFNEHWEAHVYGQKNITGNTGFISGLYGGYGYDYGLWPMAFGGNPIYGGYMGGVDRIGAGVRYMPNPSMSVEVNVEQVWLPNQTYAPTTGGNFHQQVSSFGSQHAMPTQK